MPLAKKIFGKCKHAEKPQGPSKHSKNKSIASGKSQDSSQIPSVVITAPKEGFEADEAQDKPELANDLEGNRADEELDKAVLHSDLEGGGGSDAPMSSTILSDVDNINEKKQH